MIKFHADLFFNIARLLQNIAEAPNPDALVKDAYDIPREVRGWETTYGQFKEAGMDFSALYVEQMKAALVSTDFTVGRYKLMAKVLQGRITDETGLALFMVIPKNKIEFFEKPNLFGQQVADNFPSATLDIEEAGKCYAAGRNTATVMHLMRVMEVGLRLTATALGLPDPTHANWQSIIDKINREINQKAATKDPAWLKVEPFYSQVSAHLFAVKTAWRNPVMHIHSTYDEERALDIFNAVKGFMRHLATELNE
jgi:hypothetical protein